MPWLYSGRCHVSDVYGEYVARIGGATDVEDDLAAEARAAGAHRLLIRVLVPGARRNAASGSIVDASVVPRPATRAPPNRTGRAKLLCIMRGNRWSLSELLGRVLPDHHLVTVQAWLPSGEEVTALDDEELRFQRLREEFEAFLRQKGVRDVFQIGDLPCSRNKQLQHVYRQIAQSFVARGVLAAYSDGKRRLYLVL